VPGAPRTVVISDALWHRNFAAAPDVVGKTVQLDGEPYTIVGRAPATFDFPNGSDLWTPVIFTEEERNGRTARWLTVVGELGPGVTIEQAQAEMTAAYARLKEAHEGNREYSLVGQDFEAAMVDYGLPHVIGIWQASALLLLLIAGIYRVMAHYVAQRRHEIGVRMALGATARSVLRLTLGQGLRLAGIGIVVGIAIGVALAKVMESALFGVVSMEISLFVAGPFVLALVALVATLVPARAALRVDPASVLRE